MIHLTYFDIYIMWIGESQLGILFLFNTYRGSLKWLPQMWISTTFQLPMLGQMNHNPSVLTSYKNISNESVSQITVCQRSPFTLLNPFICLPPQSIKQHFFRSSSMSQVSLNSHASARNGSKKSPCQKSKFLQINPLQTSFFLIIKRN